MAGVDFQKIHFKSVMLVLLFVVSLWAPVVSLPLGEDSLERVSVLLIAPYLESGYGHDIGSSTIDVDGLVQAEVREESMFDMWLTTEFNTSSTEHHGTPDMKLTRHDMEHYCWSTEEGLFEPPPIDQMAIDHHWWTRLHHPMPPTWWIAPSPSPPMNVFVCSTPTVPT